MSSEILTKVLEGYPLLYHLAALNEAGECRSEIFTGEPFEASVEIDGERFEATVQWVEDNLHVTRHIDGKMWVMTRPYPASIKYDFPIDNDHTESVPLIGCTLIWQDNNESHSD